LKSGTTVIKTVCMYVCMCVHENDGLYCVISVLKQDDEVAQVMAELQKTSSFYNVHNVQQLNSETFRSVTRDQHQTVMVLFYVMCEQIFVFYILSFSNFYT